EKSFPIIDRPAGVFLMSLTKLLAPKKIFEFGSGFGYSAYWFAKGLKEMNLESEIICTEGDQKNTDRAIEFLTNSGLNKYVKFLTGWAQKIFKEFYAQETFDIIYNDVDK